MSPDRYGAAEDLRGLMCQRDGCGQTMRFVYTLADVGAFCSARCRNIASQGLDERDRDEDDGHTYADPRDERDERKHG